MKCDECKAYEKQQDGHYECLADVPDEMVKQFADGKCGCKYKQRTIENLMEMAKDKDTFGASLEGQMDLSMFLAGGESADETEIPEDHPENRAIFLPGETVTLRDGDQIFTVKKQSSDRLIVYAENTQSGTVVLSTADLEIV